MQNSRTKTVAIIGAGPSGLVCAKEALECGLTPTIFEKAPNIGGLWHPETGGMWHTMSTNLSKFTCAFSDFPQSDDAPAFLTQNQMFKYLSDYCDHFGLRKHTRLSTPVTNVEQTGEKWIITFQQNDIEKSEDFDYVIIASGILSKPYFPRIEGKELYRGKIMHSADYKTPSKLDGKHVTVIGGAFSGAEIAGDLCRGGKKVTNVILSPLWVIPRNLPDTSLGEDVRVPIDLTATSSRKVKDLIKDSAPELLNRQKNSYFSQASNQNQGCPELAIEIDDQLQRIAISDDYLPYVKRKEIEVKIGEMARLDETGIIFKDGSRLDTDVIIFCTGYMLNVSFLDSKILETISYDSNNQYRPIVLYGCTFHPDLPNLAFVGTFRGAFFGLFELQARWAAQVFGRGECRTPNEEMIKGIEAEKELREKVRRWQYSHADYPILNDFFCKQINACPDFEKLKEEDPELYRMLWENPCVPSHNRLTGFGKNPELARKQLENLDKFLKMSGRKGIQEGGI